MADDRQLTNPEFSRLSFKYPDHPIFPPYAGQFTDPSFNFYQVKPGTIPPITASDFVINAAAIPEFNEKICSSYLAKIGLVVLLSSHTRRRTGSSFTITSPFSETKN
jgi:hypothetical protein